VLEVAKQKARLKKERKKKILDMDAEELFITKECIDLKVQELKKKIDEFEVERRLVEDRLIQFERNEE
jgi:hypothetical protein